MKSSVLAKHVKEILDYVHPHENLHKLQTIPLQHLCEKLLLHVSNEKADEDPKQSIFYLSYLFFLATFYFYSPHLNTNTNTTGSLLLSTSVTL